MAVSTINICMSENFLLPGPASVAILGQLMAIASTVDFSLEKNVPTDGFKYIKQPASFRACLVQISTSACDAFTAADRNMDKVRMYCMQLQGHVIDLVGIILKGSENEKSTLAPIFLNEMVEKGNKCLELAVKAESDFAVLTSLLSEVSVAATAAKGLHESKLADAISHTKILKIRKELIERRKREVDQEKLQIVEQVSEANNKFDKTVDEISGSMKTVGFSTIEKAVKTLATGACIFGLSNLAAPVAISCVALKGFCDLQKLLFGESDEDTDKERKEYEKKGLKIALKNVPEIYSLIQTLMNTVESLLCHETKEDGIKNIENQFHNEHQKKNNNDIELISKHLEIYMKDLHESIYNEHPAVETTWHLCKRVIAICFSLKQNERCIKTIEDLLKEIKPLSVLALNLRTCFDQIFSHESAACLNITTGSSKEGNGMVQQLNENVFTKIEMRRQNLEFMRRKQQFVKEKAEEIYQKHCQLLEDLSKTDLKQIHFEEIIKILSKGMDTLGRLDEQWHMMVEYFGYIMNRIEICISLKAKLFEKVLQGTEYELTAGSQNITLKAAGEIHTIAYSVGIVAKTYTEISGKHLVGASAGLIGMMALHPEKDADALNDKRRELNEKCAMAQSEIRNLAVVRRERAMIDINEQLQMLKLALSLEEERERNKIRDSIPINIKTNSKMVKDESD